MSRLREERNGESNSENSAPPKRRRGRPKKNKDEPKSNTSSTTTSGPRKRKSKTRRSSSESTGELSLDDDLDEEEEEHDEPEDDPDDPEFEPNRRTSRRQRKPVKTYNQRVLFKEEMSKSRESFVTKASRRGRPRGTGKKRAVDTVVSGWPEGLDRKKMIAGSDVNEYDRLIKEEIALYEQHLPKLPPVIPDPMQRLYVVRVDGVEALQHAGAGFRLMTSCVTDDMMVSLFHVTTDRYYVNNNAEDVLQLAQVLRHVWNMLPLKTRLAWEDAARKAALTTKEKEEASEKEEKEKEDEKEKEKEDEKEKVEEGGEEGPSRKATMPLRDFPFGIEPTEHQHAENAPCQLLTVHGPHPVDAARKNRAIESSCCSIQGKWKTFTDVQSHMIAGHYTAIFYGCHFCGTLYQSVEALLGHSDCTRWSAMLLTQMVKDGGKRMRKVHMRVAYMFLVCSDCGLWLPIRVNYPTDRLPKAWSFFATVMENHSCKKLVPLLIYMAELMEVPTRDARIFLIPVKSAKSKRFSSPDEMDLHFQKVHHIKYKCTKCGECSGTELYHKAHLTTHLSDSLLLADYLRTSCTFHPPPHCGNAPEVVGSDQRTPASGGSTTTQNPTLMAHDLVSHCEELPELKILNSLENAKIAGVSSEEETDEEEEADPCKHRADAAYENFDYSLLERSQEEKEAKKEVNEIFHKVNGTSDLEDAVLNWRCRVNDPVKTVAMLNAHPPRTVTLTTSLAADKFADLLVSKFMKRISLPISACMELLSGNLFLKRFMFCSICNTILTTQSGIDAHNKSKCGVDGLTSLYCPPAPVNSEIECPTCSFKLCSISAMRGHMAIQHGIYVEYKNVTQTVGSVSECNASLQELASRYPDLRSAVARDTDTALWLRYGVLQPKTQFDMQLKLAMKGIRVTGVDRKDKAQSPSGGNAQNAKNAPRYPIQARRTSFPPVLENMASKPVTEVKDDQRQTGSPSQGLSQHYIKPFVLVNNMLRCKFCAHQTSTPQAMRDHLQSNHVLVCRACGNGFAHREALARHGKMGRCSMFFKDASVKHISADCGVCKKRMSLASAYLHLFREHLSSVVYGTVSGQVYPEHQNLHIDQSLGEVPNAVKDPVIYSPSIDQQSKERSNREVVLYKRPANVVCSCYLCGMEMASLEQLARHLNRHTEKWTRCPFCYDNVPIPSHEVMKAHLMERHMQKRDGSWVCRYCQRMLVRGSYAHLLYMCTQTRRCALCRGEQTVKNAAEMTVHWTNRHLDILRRFQCSDCGMTFCHVEDFWAHQCRSYFMQQKCSCGFDTVFSSRTAFLLHFGMHMDEPNMTCKLCKFRFATRVALQNHRLSHAILINSSSGRQLVILDTKLVVPEVLDDKRLRRVRETEPMTEEKRLSMDVAMVIRNLMRKVCEVLGEPYEEPKDSSPHSDVTAVEDDDIVEIDSPRVDDDLVENAETAPATTRATLSAQVRIEAADGVLDAGSGMPGYVEDDEDDAIECITTENVEKAPAGAAIVKPVTDDSADDELKVIAEVEYAPGSSGATTAGGREKKFKCSKCSCTFITSYALRNHELSAHSTDAGGICDKVFGVPVRGFFFICRNCCAAFESQQQFKLHRLSHGPTGSVSCGECSAIAYNTPLYEHHRQAHATPDRLFYGCSHCNLMFRTDARLMYHLREAHGVSLFFFCKACHLGGTHERTVYAHVAVKSQRCRQFGAQKNWNSIMMLGVCPTSVLHYQPRCIATHEFTLDRNGIEVVTPSECVHRSFLAPTDSLITCRDCFCTMTAASFTAAETFRNGGVVKELAMTLDNSTEFPFLGIYDQTPVEGTSTVGSKTTVREKAPGRAIAPRPTEIQTISSSALNNMRVCPDAPSAPRLTLRPPQPSHPLPVGTRVAAVAPLMSNKINPLPVKRRPAPNSDVITLSDDEPGPSAPKRLPPPRAPVSPSPLAVKSKPVDGSNRCKICDATMPSAQIQSLHELHRNGMKWFCLDCASAQMDEVEAMKHYFSTHVKVAEQKAVEKGLLFRPLHYELQCPFPKCREPLSTLTNLRIHINNKHRPETAYSSATCMFRFCSPFAKSKHDGQHSTYESVNGVEGTCCPLCGTLNQWNIQMPGTSYTMSHIAVHGLRRYHMCRDCFVCFKGDYDCVRMKTHFETTHCTPIPKTNNRELLCKLCREVILKSHLAEHVIEKHLVTGFKSRDPKNQGKLIVKTGAVTRRFLGFERIYHVGDDSDMD
uniref:C2H2-type domain-containing protein n=2 Tax=Trichostrongylidae TaxID=6315 RepID=A0A7I5E9J3_HAECO